VNCTQTRDSKFKIINEMAITIKKSKNEWFDELANQIKSNLETKNYLDKEKSKRAVIVFFANDTILEEFSESTQYKYLDIEKTELLTEKDDNENRN